jgi:LmbE family N-acetylglucosaminyl deacetylase
MRTLDLHGNPRQPLRILYLGAHSDDIEIARGGSILRLLHECRTVDVDW